MVEEKIIEKRHVAKFITSVAHFKDMPQFIGDEYAILGRSNVGKSSFVNHVLENKDLARVSKTPGKTSLANVYHIDETFYFIDLPGYGYAKVSGDEKARWSKLINDYCTKRESLKGLLWLLDIRHPGIKADLEAFEWLKLVGKPILPILTKGDKLTVAHRNKKSHEFVKAYGFTTEPVIYSTLEHASRENFWGRFEKWMIME